MDKQTANNNRHLKRTINGKRVLIEKTDKGQRVINAILAKHRSRYLSLWKAPSRTDEERAFMGKFERVLGKLKSRQTAVIGTWA